jgi:protein subunit release factor B
MIETNNYSDQPEILQEQPEEQQEAQESDPKKKNIQLFLNQVRSYQTEQNSTEDGWYSVILNQGDHALQTANALTITFGVSGIIVSPIDHRNHELSWNPSLVK